MGKIALTQNISLDGVMQLDGLMQSPDPTDVPFKYTGSALDFDGGPEGVRFNYEEEFGLEQAHNSEILVLGRVPYEAMQAFWPTAEGELANRLNELPKYVVSSTLTDPSLERDRPGRRLAGGSGQAAKGARRRDPRLWQPPPLAGTDRDGAGARAAPTGLPGGALVPEVACSGSRRTRSRCAWSNRVRSGEAW